MKDEQYYKGAKPGDPEFNPMNPAGSLVHSEGPSKKNGGNPAIYEQNIKPNELPLADPSESNHTKEFRKNTNAEHTMEVDEVSAFSETMERGSNES